VEVSPLSGATLTTTALFQKISPYIIFYMVRERERERERERRDRERE